MPRLLVLVLLAQLAGCATTAPDAPAEAEPAAGLPFDPTGQDAAVPWFDPTYQPPTTLTTGRVLLEPLAVEHVELDFAALMGSREHLRRSLRWGDWPREGFTLAENRADLARHWSEFEQREGYAFTVLAPDRSRCLGCIYLEPVDELDTESRDAMLAYWVIEEQLASDLDRHLLAAVLAWIERDWPFQRIIVPVHADNARGAELARELRLTALDEPGPASHELFAWER